MVTQIGLEGRLGKALWLGRTAAVPAAASPACGGSRAARGIGDNGDSHSLPSSTWQSHGYLAARLRGMGTRREPLAARLLAAGQLRGSAHPSPASREAAWYPAQ